MKIRLYSDLHLEVTKNKDGWNPCLDGADVLVLAGDISIGTHGVEWASQFDIPVIMVLGNHDYYDNDLLKLIPEVKKAAKGTNVHLLERDSVTLEDVTFHGCTLWTDYKIYGLSSYDIAKNACQSNMLDFRRIQCGHKMASPGDYENIHRMSVDWLENSLGRSSTEKNIVVTHHAPSLTSSHSIYKHMITTAGFASDLHELVDDHKPDYWFHGHMHNPSDYMLSDTRVIANPRGYPGESLARYFDPRLTIEI